MEAGRSRTGRPILPKAGLLSVVIETYLQGHMSNAYIVPVSVSYEKLIEGSFSHELMVSVLVMGERRAAEGNHESVFPGRAEEERNVLGCGQRHMERLLHQIRLGSH